MNRSTLDIAAKQEVVAAPGVIRALSRVGRQGTDKTGRDDQGDLLPRSLFLHFTLKQRQGLMQSLKFGRQTGFQSFVVVPTSQVEEKYISIFATILVGKNETGESTHLASIILIILALLDS